MLRIHLALKAQKVFEFSLIFTVNIVTYSFLSCLVDAEVAFKCYQAGRFLMMSNDFNKVHANLAIMRRAHEHPFIKRESLHIHALFLVFVRLATQQIQLYDDFRSSLGYYDSLFFFLFVAAVVNAKSSRRVASFFLNRTSVPRLAKRMQFAPVPLVVLLVA